MTAISLARWSGCTLALEGSVTAHNKGRIVQCLKQHPGDQEQQYKSRIVTKPTKLHVRPAKTRQMSPSRLNPMLA